MTDDGEVMFLGVEIGGTKLQLGLGTGDSRLAGLWRGSVDPSAGGEGIRQQILRAIPELLRQAGVERAQLRAAGVGFGGPVDDATRSVIKSHQIDGWDGFPLADWFADLVGLPTVLGNDADVAGLAEATVGAGRGLSPVFYVTVGSGIGGGLIIDGEIYRGCGRGAAEIGHLRVPECVGDEAFGEPLERRSSGWAIQESGRHTARDPEAGSRMLEMVGGNADAITGETVALAARAGDGPAQAVLGYALDALSEALCHVIALLCPRRIVVGGGVSLMGEELFFEPLRRRVAERVFRPFAGLTDIVPAALGEEVVVHGAIELAKRV